MESFFTEVSLGKILVSETELNINDRLGFHVLVMPGFSLMDACAADAFFFFLI